MTERFIIGIIGSPFGVKGFVKVRSSSGEVDHFLKLQSVIVNKDNKEREYQIDEIAVCAPPVVHIKFKGIDSPESAKTLSGAQLIVSREQAAPLSDKDEFYIEDLKGLPVQSDKGEIIGHVTDIIDGGSGNLMEIKLIVSSDMRFIPFRKEFFSVIDPENGILILQDLTIMDIYPYWWSPPD
ncbi:MAG: ribosome maturation factor RimM [Treponema sp.]|nr:ribosome maturation factor RimM [Treponema sp.]